MLGAVASALYIVDAHRESLIVPSGLVIPRYTDCGFVGEIAVEAFTCLLVFKNMFSFALTWAAYDWIKNGGIARIFYIIASVQVGVCLLSIPMCRSNPYPNPITCFRTKIIAM